MVELNHRERTIKVKIVYYGPAVGGKTTNLQVMHQHALAQRRGELVSVNSAQDRTILFDLLPIRAAGFRGFDLRLQILAVPGQAMYAATRRLVLKGADSLVFVANSAADRWEENVHSFREMTENLLALQLDPSGMPLVLQYNKRDLVDVTPIDFMDRTLNARTVEAVPAVAVRGEGVLETFAAILSRTMHDLATRYQIADVGRGQRLQDWTRNTMMGMFGTTSLMTIGGSAVAPAEATFESPVGPPPDRHTIHLDLPEEAARRAGLKPDDRANAALVESYAQAAGRLSNDLADVREQRDLYRRRLSDIEQTLAAAQDVLAGQPLESALRSVLGPMANSSGSTHASFLIPSMDRTFRAAVLRGMPEDPLLRVPAGVRHVTERFFHEAEPRVHLAADTLDLGEALSTREPAFAAVVSVPVRTPRGLQGLAMLYYTPDEALPRADILEHVSAMARALSASLELAAALESARQAERTLHMALVGTASMHGMEDALTSILLVRERLAAMRRRTDMPAAVQEEFGRLTPLLSSALATGKSLVAFSRGEIHREVVQLKEVLGELAAGGIDVQLGPGAGAVLGDAVLLRLAVLSMLDHARSSHDGLLAIRAVAEAGRIKIRVANGAPVAPAGGRPDAAGRPAAGPNLRLAFIQKIATLHGGHLATEVDDSARSWTTLSLLPG